jgi:hypothetical protein
MYNKIKIPYPINVLNHFLGQILFKLAEIVKNGKNGIPLFCFIFSILNRSAGRGGLLKTQCKIIF